MTVELPPAVTGALAVAQRAGFTMSSEPEAGAFLAVLAAAVPVGGRILELGTGAGVGTAWITHGLGSRTDVEVVTVDIAPDVVDRSAFPPYVRFVAGDAVEVTAREGTFDLVFADSQGGKWTGLDVTVAALRPGGQLLVDDMASASTDQRQGRVRDTLVGSPDLVSVSLAWSSGLILCTRRHTSHAPEPAGHSS